MGAIYGEKKLKTETGFQIERERETETEGQRNLDRAEKGERGGDGEKGGKKAPQDKSVEMQEDGEKLLTHSVKSRIEYSKQMITMKCAFKQTAHTPTIKILIILLDYLLLVCFIDPAGNQSKK